MGRIESSQCRTSPSMFFALWRVTKGGCAPRSFLKIRKYENRYPTVDVFCPMESHERGVCTKIIFENSQVRKSLPHRRCFLPYGEARKGGVHQDHFGSNRLHYFEFFRPDFFFSSCYFGPVLILLVLSQE